MKNNCVVQPNAFIGGYSCYFRYVCSFFIIILIYKLSPKNVCSTKINFILLRFQCKCIF